MSYPSRSTIILGNDYAWQGNQASRAWRMLPAISQFSYEKRLARETNILRTEDASNDLSSAGHNYIN